MNPIIPQNLTQHTFDFDALTDQPVDDVVPHTNSAPPQKQKYCHQCKQWFPATTEYWHHARNTADGLCSPCKTCKRNKYIANHPHPCIRCNICSAVIDHLCDECYKWKQNNPDVKFCPTCKQWLSTDRFDKKGNSKDGLRGTCKSCRHNQYLAHSKETLQKQHKAYYAKAPDERRKLLDRMNAHRNERSIKERQAGMCSKCLARPAESGHRVCNHCYAYRASYGDELRNQVFAAYGSKCAICGESHPAFLSVDHIHNDGAEHRRTTGNGYRLYLWLRKNGFPQEGFQLLCSNCNWLKHVSHRPAEKSYMTIWHANLRQETIAAYGGICVCCGESNPDVLTIDHVNGEGNDHRRQVGAGSRFYQWLRKNGFPQDGRFQILCFNCNRAKYFHGVCPHQK